MIGGRMNFYGQDLYKSEENKQDSIYRWQSLQFQIYGNYLRI